MIITRRAQTPCAFRAANTGTRSLVKPAAIGAAGDLAGADKDRPCDKARFETPWQDRQTLLPPATR